MRSRGSSPSRVVALGVSGIFAFVAAPSSAQTEERPRAAMHYSVEDGLQECPSEPELRAAVAARLGYDPFVGDRAEVEVDLRLERRLDTLIGTVQVSSADGEPLGEREIASTSSDCRELGRALALATSMVIAPFVPPPLEEVAPLPVAGPDVASATPEPAEPQPPTDIASRASQPLEIGAGLGGSFAVLPRPRPTIMIAAHRRLSRFGWSAVGDADWPLDVSADSNARVNFLRFGARIAGCVEEPRNRVELRGCSGLAASLIVAESSKIPAPRLVRTGVLSVPLELSATFVVTPRFAVTLDAGVAFSLWRPEFVLDFEPIHRVPIVSAFAGLFGARRWP